MDANKRAPPSASIVCVWVRESCYLIFISRRAAQKEEKRRRKKKKKEEEEEEEEEEEKAERKKGNVSRQTEKRPKANISRTNGVENAGFEGGRWGGGVHRHVVVENKRPDPAGQATREREKRERKTARQKESRTEKKRRNEPRQNPEPKRRPKLRRTVQTQPVPKPLTRKTRSFRKKTVFRAVVADLIQKFIPRNLCDPVWSTRNLS